MKNNVLLSYILFTCKKSQAPPQVAQSLENVRIYRANRYFHYTTDFLVLHAMQIAQRESHATFFGQFVNGSVYLPS